MIDESIKNKVTSNIKTQAAMSDGKIKAEDLIEVCKKYYDPEKLKVINIKPAME